MATFPAWPLVDPIVDRALAEDLAGGDITTDATIDPKTQAVAHFVPRGEVVVCGAAIAERVFARLEPNVRFEIFAVDGQKIGARQRWMSAYGSARTLLMGERVALNLIQRMTGIATTTRRYVDARVPNSRTRIVDTRKTTPGLRILERYAVRTGGGCNHRDMLGSAVLIKDNHIVAAGSVSRAIAAAKNYSPHTSKITCEVDTLEQLDEALDAGADVVLLDNMSDAVTEQAMVRIRTRAPHVLAEASGGITFERVGALSSIGVDVISVGALTHSVIAADIGLDLELV